jgi:arsenate reductase-like glutaredoxin family protein
MDEPVPSLGGSPALAAVDSVIHRATAKRPSDRYVDATSMSEDLRAALGLADPKKPRSELIDAIAAHPRLLQRPIVVYGSNAAIGRPPEAVLGILPD